MYAYITGIVDELLTDRAVLEAGGVGYELFCSAMTLKRLRAGQKERLYTHLHLAEGIMALYGFYEPEEKDMFRRLLTVTRVGPKLALSVLSVLTPSDVAGAIVTNNAAAFDRVSGMGRKTAQRVLLELKERVEASEMLGAVANADAPDIRSEAVAALVSLGYDGLAAGKAVAAVEKAESVEALITAALRRMAK
ncbi:MAG: Holliday junction branch migration protein RuvA [Firmicutes bacterium HGW-Firmicutes-9]|nr:MAG: Holliday junction branch migration protein RuvA [Firmicutes bacterium HGW-Firmicutes-9]